MFNYRFLEDEGITGIHGFKTESGLEISWSGPILRSFIIRLNTGWTPKNVLQILPSRTNDLDWQEIKAGVFQIKVADCDSAKLEIKR
jgi:hypothetical protein